MEETLKELKAVHSSNLLIILSGSTLRIYDEDANIVEFISNLISKSSVLICKYKYLENITNILKKKKIDYTILDKDSGYKIFKCHRNDINKYNKYLKLSKRFNKFRRYLIYFYNFIFGIPINRYN